MKKALRWAVILKREQLKNIFGAIPVKITTGPLSFPVKNSSICLLNFVTVYSLVQIV